MQSLQAKQRYLRERIPAAQYEEFSAYIEEHVGNEDIDRWSQEFVHEIVQDYLKSREKYSIPHETSFYMYQHANDHPQIPPIDPWLLSKINQEGNKQKQDQNKAKQDLMKVNQNLKVSKAETTSMDAKPNSALLLFDSVFDPNNKATKNQPPPSPKPIASKPPPEMGRLNEFDSNQFWGSSSGANKVSSNTNYNTNSNKLSKSNVDFTNFDFWQPQPKTDHVDLPLSVRVVPTNEKQKSNVIPSFDDLLLQMKDEVRDNRGEKEERGKERGKGKKQEGKAPSPYQKKNYPQQQVAVPVVKIVKVPYQGPIVIKSDFSDSVKCFPSAQRKSLKGKELSVAVEAHHIVNRTFLMPDYVMYSMRVKPLNTLIQRNYDDFTKLRAVLADFFPGTKLAYLEGNSWFGATGPEQTKRQKVMLEFFLNDLLRNKEVCNSRFIEDFLTLNDHKRIKRKFEEFEQLERPKSIEQLCLLQGKVDVTLSDQQRQYQEHLKKYQERMIDFLDRQERLTQELAQQYKALGKTLETLMDLTTSIIEETKRFNQRVYGLEVLGVEEVLKVVRGCYAEEKKLAGFNLDLFTNCQLPFISYERSNTKELDDLISNQQSFMRSYLRRSEVQKCDPTVPYTSDKLASSKVAVGSESKNIIVLKYQAGFFGNQICHQAKRTFQALSAKIKELWGRTAAKKQEQCLQSLDFWKGVDGPLPSFS